MRLGSSGRVLVGAAVVLTAVPVIVLSASGPGNVTIEEPALVNLSLDQAELRPIAVPASVMAIAAPQKKRAELKPHRVEMQVTPAQAQEKEAEPWRSTRKATAEDTVAPVASLRLNPKYTADAMRAKIQGQVKVEIIVSPEGNVTDARVVTSLDPLLGLDDEAMKTARQWKFVPGTYQGQPVALRVTLDFEFRLH